MLNERLSLSHMGTMVCLFNLLRVVWIRYQNPLPVLPDTLCRLQQ